MELPFGAGWVSARNRALRFQLVKRRRTTKSGAARRSARSAALRTNAFAKKYLPLRPRRWPRLGYGRWAAGLIHAVQVLSAVVSRARFVCPGVRRAHGASGHFHDREAVAAGGTSVACGPS